MSVTEFDLGVESVIKFKDTLINIVTFSAFLSLQKFIYFKVYSVLKHLSIFDVHKDADRL